MRRFNHPFRLLSGWLIIATGLLLTVMVVSLAGRAISVEPTLKSQSPLDQGLGEITLGAPAEDQPQTGLPLVEIRIDGKPYQVEIASTPEQSQKGLMYRTFLPDDHGMLFTFDPVQVVNFWMKNTKIPLDIVFLADGKVSRIVEDAPPCLSDPCPIYGSEEPVDQVLELKAGTAEKNDISEGSVMEMDKLQSVSPLLPASEPKSK